MIKHSLKSLVSYPENHTVIRILNKHGICEFQFLAYPPQIKGGVNVNVGKIFGKENNIVVNPISAKNVNEIKTGDRAAISMPDVVVGKHIEEGDVLENYISDDDLEKLQAVKDKLRPDEKELLKEIGEE